MTSDDVPVAKKARVEASVADLKSDAQQQAEQAAINEIEETEVKLNEIIDEQADAIIKIEQEYVAKFNPLYEKRAQQIAKIPDFWATAFSNHPIISQMLTEEDMPLIKCLKEIKVNQTNEEIVCEKPTKDGKTQVKTLNVAFHFIFDENEYFEETELVKSFYQIGDCTVSETNNSKGITWKKGKCLIGANGEGDLESFFAWFDDHENADNDEIAETIREELWPHALNYYLNEDEDSDEDPTAEVDLEDEDEDETAE